MGRHAASLLRLPSRKLASTNGLHLVSGSSAFTVENHLTMNTDEGAFWLQTTLLDLRTGERPSFTKSLSGRMTSGRESWHDWDSEYGLDVFRRAMLACPATTLQLVVLLPERDDETNKTVRAALSAVLRNTWHAVAPVILLSNDSVSWTDLCALSPAIRFLHVLDLPGHLERAGETMFLAYCSFLAPVLLTCADYEDLDSCLADAFTAGRVVLGNWNSVAGKLEVANSDARAVAECHTAFIAPLWPQATLLEVSRLCGNVREFAGLTREIVLSASTGFFLHPGNKDDLRPVAVLCRF